jgi:uncharacterized protein (DUF3084 family)
VTGAEWATLIIGGVGGTAGVAALLNAVFGRSKTKAEAAQVVVGSAVTLMNELEEAAREARQESRAAHDEAKASRSESRAAHQEMAEVRKHAHALADELHRLRTAIMHPDATIEALRALVGSGPGPATNGRPHL